MTENAYSIAAYVFSIMSIIFYTILTFPQIYTIFKLKTSESVSILTLMVWCTADTMNLMGVLLLQLEKTLQIIGWYHLLMSYTLLMICIAFNNRVLVFVRLFCCVVIFCEFVSSMVLNILIDTNVIMTTDSTYILGTLFGWVSIVMYIISRIPQIYLNYKNQSTIGLSMYMFILNICGNICYGLSILLISTEHYYIIKNLPWLMLCIGCTVLDIVIIIQCNIYK